MTNLDTVRAAVVAVPIVNEVTQDEIITVFELENAVWLGVSFGAWFKIGMAVALALLILERTINVVHKLRYKKYDK
jgi:hypothetical protein